MLLSPHPHRRFNLLTGEWVLVSPGRLQRPWQGKREQVLPKKLPVHDPHCYLCPGNRRAGGEPNPVYQGTFVFTNDYAALTPKITEPLAGNDGLLVFADEQGLCRVVCYAPDHNLSIALMNQRTILNIIDVWCDEYRSLGAEDAINYVQIFENHGKQMGCSNPHPHGQIWANQTIPVIPAREAQQQAQYLKNCGQCLLCDYIAQEVKLGDRIVFKNEHFIVLVPFWAVWPYEVMVLPRAHRADLTQLTAEEKQALAAVLQELCIRYDNLFETEFPYSMGIHQQPVDGREHPGWHFHFHYYPPLLRSAEISKFMVGYEMLAAPQRDLTAEFAAARLRELPKLLYTISKEQS